MTEQKGRICTLHFDAKFCWWQQDTSRTLDEQLQFCRHVNCPHATISEYHSSGKVVMQITCDYSWNPFANRETTKEEREEMKMQ